MNRAAGSMAVTARCSRRARRTARGPGPDWRVSPKPSASAVALARAPAALLPRLAKSEPACRHHRRRNPARAPGVLVTAHLRTLPPDAMSPSLPASPAPLPSLRPPPWPASGRIPSKSGRSAHAHGIAAVARNYVPQIMTRLFSRAPNDAPNHVDGPSSRNGCDRQQPMRRQTSRRALYPSHVVGWLPCINSCQVLSL